ncbi:MAG: transporter permease [Hyphomicrobiales bacterium]|nr:transporter permease [Hyphomicrobiales bacterium]
MTVRAGDKIRQPHAPFWGVRGRGLTPALVILIVMLALTSLCIGAAHLSPADVWAGLHGVGTAGIIVLEIRLPRLLLALSVGAMLGLSGASLQGLLRNPLAEPAIFGAPQAAALGAVIVLYSGMANAVSWALPLAAIAGALVSMLLVFVVAGRGAHLITMLLSGLAVASLAGAATSLVINLSPNPFAVTEIVFWLMGSFEDRSLHHVLLATPFIALSALVLLGCGRGYRALTLGDDVARSLGVNVARLRVATIAATACGIGAGVAVSGAIGFVGLVAPHLARPLVGGDPQRVLVPSALIGAAILVAADILVRLVPATSEIKVGVVTALIGVPMFLYLVISRKAFFGGDAST